MKSFRSFPIRYKLTLIIMATSSVVVILPCSFFIANDIWNLRQNLLSDLSFKTRIIAAAAASVIADNDRRAASELLQTLQDDSQIIAACLYDKDDKELARYVRNGNYPLDYDFPAGYGDNGPDPGRLYKFQKVLVDGAPAGTVFIEKDIKMTSDLVRRYALAVALVLLITLIVAFLLSMVLQRAISQPILHLVDVADLVSRNKDYSIRANTSGDDELGLLVNGFNKMLSQIQDQDLALQTAREKLEERVKDRTEELLQEIQVRRHVEEQIKASLKEKDVLLKEVHHRVKNNLQVICSLLNIQSNYINDPESKRIFDESQSRVRSMALIHENLYKSEDLTRIQFAAYIRNLSTQLFHTYSVNSERIQLDFDLKPIVLNIETAIPCGLIVNELITNALKYAFPARDSGSPYQLRISATKLSGNLYQLTITDNGVGIAEDIKVETCESLGLKLVNILVQQLKGKLSVARSNGTQFTLQFADLNYKDRFLVHETSH